MYIYIHREIILSSSDRILWRPMLLALCGLIGFLGHSNVKIDEAAFSDIHCVMPFILCAMFNRELISRQLNAPMTSSSSSQWLLRLRTCSNLSFAVMPSCPCRLKPSEVGTHCPRRFVIHKSVWINTRKTMCPKFPTTKTTSWMYQVNLRSWDFEIYQLWHYLRVGC